MSSIIFFFQQIIFSIVFYMNIATEKNLFLVKNSIFHDDFYKKAIDELVKM